MRRTAERRIFFKRFVFLILIVAVVGAGIYILSEHPEKMLRNLIMQNDFKVMTYNINHGEGTDGIYSLNRIIRIIRAQSPHIVCLNEVDFKTDRTFGEDQARKIAASLGMEFTYAKNFPFEDGWHGNAILTRFPIVFSENKIFKSKESLENRSLLHTILKCGVKRIHFCATQLSADSSESASQSNELLSSVLDLELNEPVIIAGDFNMEPFYQRIKEITFYFLDIGSYLEPEGSTYPGINPEKRVDYIFSNELLIPTSVNIIQDEMTAVASDHLPMVVQFQLKDE